MRPFVPAVLAAALLALPGALAGVPVVAAGFSFLAPAVVVPLGTSVDWIGAALPHTVTTTAGPNGAPNDPMNADANPDTFNDALPMGSSLSHTFRAEGVFHYRCDLHFRTGMLGAVVVFDPNGLP